MGKLLLWLAKFSQVRVDWLEKKKKKRSNHRSFIHLPGCWNQECALSKVSSVLPLVGAVQLSSVLAKQRQLAEEFQQPKLQLAWLVCDELERN